VQTFSAEQFEAWAEPSYFDMHIISPKFLAFRGYSPLLAPSPPCPALRGAEGSGV
jgi:hypothetical protein